MKKQKTIFSQQILNDPEMLEMAAKIEERREILALRKELAATTSIMNTSLIHITIRNAAVSRCNEIVSHLKELGINYTIDIVEGVYHVYHEGK